MNTRLHRPPSRSRLQWHIPTRRSVSIHIQLTLIVTIRPVSYSALLDTLDTMALKSKVTAPATAPARRLVAPRPVSRRVVQVQAAKDYGRVFNFSAGPAILPLDVLEKAQADLINWQGSGMSIMEMSHRGKEFESVIQKAEADLRALLNIPSNYKVSSGLSCRFLFLLLARHDQA